jgi:hypothetical protein
VYTTKIRPVVEYACQVWHPGLTDYLSQNIEQVQKRALRIVNRNLSYSEALSEYNLQTLKQRRENMCTKFFCQMKKEDHKLNHLIPKPRKLSYSLRKAPELKIPKLKTYRARGSLVNRGMYQQLQ